jgi:hypothetical protein
MLKVIRFDVLKPVSSVSRFCRLRTNNPAPIRSNSDNATCAITSALRRRI